MPKNFPESKQPKGTFSWIAQQPAKPLCYAPRPITPKENLRRVFSGETPMWIPLWLKDSQYCWADVVLEHPAYEKDGKDWFGVEWVWVDIAGGMMVKPGTRTLSDITKWKEELVMPDLDQIDWEGDAALQTARFEPDRMHLFHLTEGLFERLHEMIPFDEALIAFYEEPKAVQEFFTAIADHKIRLLKKIFAYYEPIDYIIYGDDWGTQRAGFFSNEMFREFIMPQTKRIIDFVHSQGKFVELHSCGLSGQYIKEMVEMGLDAWSPQPINDFEYLTENFGHQIALTVPIDGLDKEGITEEEARKIVRDFVDHFAPRGRIVASIRAANPDIAEAAEEELYLYSSEYYKQAKK